MQQSKCKDYAFCSPTRSQSHLIRASSASLKHHQLILEIILHIPEFGCTTNWIIIGSRPQANARALSFSGDAIPEDALGDEPQTVLPPSPDRLTHHILHLQSLMPLGPSIKLIPQQNVIPGLVGVHHVHLDFVSRILPDRPHHLIDQGDPGASS